MNTMVDQVLFKRLTSTDFNAMRGVAQMAGTGGGAMHIALGVDNPDSFPIKSFLKTRRSTITIDTQAHPPNVSPSSLTFDGNPGRRGGEWRITDQRSHRHPCWHDNNGFPTRYDENNPPIIFIIRVGAEYHVRFLMHSDISNVSDLLARSVNAQKGILQLRSDWIDDLNLASGSLLREYESILETIQETEEVDQFDPSDAEDGRERTLRDIVNRQGQHRFRRRLLHAYNGTCAITNTTTEVTLQACHITPYRGPQTNAVSNGLLLRADIHTLFDLGLIAIEPRHFNILVSSALDDSTYTNLNRQRLNLPIRRADRPSTAALNAHLDIFKH